MSQWEFDFSYNGAKLTDWERFKFIHKDRPQIYEVFTTTSLDFIDRGIKRYSAYGVMHIVRWRIFIPGVDMRPPEDFKISDHMTPFYARLFLRDNPKYEEFFQTKEIRLQGFQEEWINQI